MMKELTAKRRKQLRFERFRARQRFRAGLGRNVAFGPELRQLYKETRGDQGADKKKKLKGKRKRAKKQELFNEARKLLRFASFGKPPFSHGKVHSPTPRKILIDGIARWLPVLLVWDFRTSKMCHSCGNETKDSKSYREKRCLNNNFLVKFRVVSTDRDINGAMNMGQLGLYFLLNGASKRPPPLRTKKQIEDAAAAEGAVIDSEDQS